MFVNFKTNYNDYMENLQEGINAKCCNVCKELKSFNEYYKSKENKYGLSYRCKKCQLEYNQSRLHITRVTQAKRRDKKRKEVNAYNLEWYHNNPEKSMLKQVKARAKKKGIEFNLTLEDIIIPELCPLLEIPIIRGSKDGYRQSASLDRIDPNKGYIKGNVRVISMRANVMKNDATKEELMAFFKNLEKYYE